jgi:hypothetical protein
MVYLTMLSVAQASLSAHQFRGLGTDPVGRKVIHTGNLLYLPITAAARSKA